MSLPSRSFRGPACARRWEMPSFDWPNFRPKNRRILERRRRCRRRCRLRWALRLLILGFFRFSFWTWRIGSNFFDARSDLIDIKISVLNTTLLIFLNYCGQPPSFIIPILYFPFFTFQFDWELVWLVQPIDMLGSSRSCGESIDGINCAGVIWFGKLGFWAQRKKFQLPLPFLLFLPIIRFWFWSLQSLHRNPSIQFFSFSRLPGHTSLPRRLKWALGAKVWGPGHPNPITTL